MSQATLKKSREQSQEESKKGNPLYLILDLTSLVDMTEISW